MNQEINDSVLVENLKIGKNVDESLREIVSRHSGIFITMVNAYTPDREKEDMINDKEYYIYQAALKYDEERKTKFSTYLGSETRWMCLNNYNKNKKKNEVSLSAVENYLQDDSYSTSFQDTDSVKKVLQMTKIHPDKRVGRIFELRYSNDSGSKLTPWSEICSHVGLSVQGSINVHDQAITSIKQQLQKEL